MKLEYTISLDAVKELFVMSIKTNPFVIKRTRRFKYFYNILNIIVLTIVLLYKNSYLVLLKKENLFKSFIFLCCIFAFIMFFNLYVFKKCDELNAKIAAKKYAEKIYHISIPKVLTLTDSKLISQSKDVKLEVPLHFIKKASEHKGNIYIFLQTDGVFTIVPLEAFKTLEEKTMFLKKITKNQ